MIFLTIFTQIIKVGADKLKIFLANSCRFKENSLLWQQINRNLHENMSKIIENSKGFKIIEISDRECKEKIGGLGICDDCNKDFQTAYYIAVLNHCYCQGCYDSWMERAEVYASDKPIEEKNFNWMLKRVPTNPFDLEVQFQIFLDRTDGGFASERTKEFTRDIFYGTFYLFMELMRDDLSVLSDSDAVSALEGMEHQFSKYASERLEEKRKK